MIYVRTVQVRSGDARGAEDPADAQPLVQVFERVVAAEGSRRVRGSDQLRGRFVHTRSDRPARGPGAPSVQQGPAGTQVHGLPEGVVPQRQIHIHGARRPGHRPFDHIAKSKSIHISKRFHTNPSYRPLFWSLKERRASRHYRSHCVNLLLDGVDRPELLSFQSVLPSNDLNTSKC